MRSQAGIQNIAQILEIVARNEQYSEQISQAVLKNVDSNEKYIIGPPLMKIISSSDIGYFYVIKSAIKLDYQNLLVAMLNLNTCCKFSHVEVNFFVLLLIPRLNHPKPEKFVDVIITTFHLKANPEQKYLTTFSVQTLQAYVIYLLSNPKEILISYQFYRKYLNDPRLENVPYQFDASNTYEHSCLMTVLDLISGELQFSYNFTDEEVRSIKLLTFIDFANFDENDEFIHDLQQFLFLCSSWLKDTFF